MSRNSRIVLAAIVVSVLGATGHSALAAALCGNYNVGLGGDYPSLTRSGGAFEALNSSGASCPIIFYIISDLTVENGANPINAIASGASVLIRPSLGARQISGASTGTGLITLNGADNVTIDGSLNALPGNQDLTITNTNGPFAGVVWMHSTSAGDGATGNTVRNCRIRGAGVGGSETVVGVWASGSNPVQGAEAPNSNNTVENNTIEHVQNAVYIYGNVALDQNWTITGNTFGSTVTADKLAYRGMLIADAKDFTIAGNTIRGVVSPTNSSGSETGIAVYDPVLGGSIRNNKISDIKQTNPIGYGASGMSFFLASGSDLTVSNNFVWDIAAQGKAGIGWEDNGYGLVVYSGSGLKLYDNSIGLAGTQGVNAAIGITAALNVLSTVTDPGAIDMRNNILSNVETLGTRYGVICSAPASVFASIDNNDYFAQNVGFIAGAARSTLVSWQAQTGQDAQSKAVDPQFVSATDLHLNSTGGASEIENAGLALGVIIDDIDGDSRDPVAPDIGADELHCHAAVPAETCNDGDPCTSDGCSPATGCFYTPVPAPGEVQNVAAAADHTTYTWPAIAGAMRYDAVRGSLSALPVGPIGGDETCFDDLPTPSLFDASVPDPGAGYWYLSRGENACGNGTYGTQRDGTPRVTATCP